MPKYNSKIWDYFEPNPDNKIADCKLCDKKLSYKTTTANLKQHLKLKHTKGFDEYLTKDDSFKPRVLMPRANNAFIWNYFDQSTDVVEKLADCRLCKKRLSYKTTIANLKQHLKKHNSYYNEFVAKGESIVLDSSEDNSISSGSDDAAEELLKVTDVWSYFDIDASGKRAQCVPCKATVANEYEELKAHLKVNHPKLLLQILQDKDQNSDAASNDGDTDNDIFTEVVYLDPEPTENVTKKGKRKSQSKPTLKRESRHSICNSDESPIKKPKIDEENDELASFVKYITCLLKKLPADVFSNVQIDIINTILKANSQNTRSILLNKEQVNTCPNIITVDGITPITSAMAGHNYTITVAAPKDGETENS